MQVAVACLKVASQAVSTMPFILFFPIFPFLLTAGVMVYWVIVTAFLYSAADIVPHYTTSTIAANPISISVSIFTKFPHPFLYN